MALEALKEYAELSAQEKREKAAHDRTKQKLAELEAPARAEMQEAGLTNYPSVHGVTVYLDTTLWAKAPRKDPDDPESDPDWETANAALRAIGLGHYVAERFDVGALSAHFRRERENREEALEAEGKVPLVPVEDLVPPAARGKIIVAEASKLKAVKAKKSS